MKDHAICIAIGPLTYEALLKHGLSANVADEHTVSGTFKLLLKLIKDNMSNVR
jgi:uroporphyrinogen-III synthase